jgi:hypothetical protein
MLTSPSFVPLVALQEKLRRLSVCPEGGWRQLVDPKETTIKNLGCNSFSRNFD